MKRKKVFLLKILCSNQDSYTVVKTINKLEPSVGSSITSEQVRRLIASKDTDIIISEK